MDAFVSSVILTSFFSFMALGMNLIFGVMRIVNLAHGNFMMLGSYVAILIYGALKWNPVYSLIVVAPLFLAIAFPLYYLVVPRLLKGRDPEISSFILFFGLAYIIEAIAIDIFGNSFFSLPEEVFGAGRVSILGTSQPLSWVIIALVSVGAMVLLYVYLYHTRIGLYTRALMANRNEARSTGINVHFVSAVAFAISIAIIASAGSFSSILIEATTPSIGNSLTVIAFTIVIVGSLGKTLATAAGGAVYAFAYEYANIYIPTWASLVPYVILIAIVLIRPYGIFGGRQREF